MDVADAYFQKMSGRQKRPLSTSCWGTSTTGPRIAAALARLLKLREGPRDLIPYNPVAGLPFERPMPEPVEVRGGLQARRVRGASGRPRGARSTRPVASSAGGLNRGDRGEARPAAFPSLKARRPATGEVWRDRVRVPPCSQLEAKDPDVRLMLQVRDDVQGAFETLVEPIPASASGCWATWSGALERRKTSRARGLPADLPGLAGYKPRAKFSTWLLHDRQQPGVNHPQGQGAEPTVPGIKCRHLGRSRWLAR